MQVRGVYIEEQEVGESTHHGTRREVDMQPGWRTSTHEADKMQARGVYSCSCTKYTRS
jgi:hypothetical protein